MRSANLDWTDFAAELEGPGFARFQRALTKFNGRSLQPRLPGESWRDDLAEADRVGRAEVDYIESVRRAIAPLTADVPGDVEGFLAWFERLRETGPGQGDPLFPWLAAHASLEQMKWFLFQEVAGEAGFDDLL